jgi:hypothetical protein
VYTVTDGAIRLIVLLHAKTLGFTPIQIALMFVMYELAGVFTNLFGGIAAVRYGLKTTLFVSLACQLIGLTLLIFVEYIFQLQDATPVFPNLTLTLTLNLTLNLNLTLTLTLNPNLNPKP